MIRILFTDIDGVLNPHWSTKWAKKSIQLYNDLCKEYDLKVVISSTWRVNHTKEQLQEIFKNQGIEVEIYDYTPVLSRARGLEIQEWLDNNHCDDFVVIDDKTSDIEPYIKRNVIKCRNWVGFTLEEYTMAKKLLNG